MATKAAQQATGNSRSLSVPKGSRLPTALPTVASLEREYLAAQEQFDKDTASWSKGQAVKYLGSLVSAAKAATLHGAANGKRQPLTLEVAQKWKAYCDEMFRQVQERYVPAPDKKIALDSASQLAGAAANLVERLQSVRQR